MSIYNEEYLKRTIQEIFEPENFSNNAIIQFSKGKQVGDGYMGDIVTFKIFEGSRTLNLVAKISTKNKEVRAVKPIQEAYENELYFYKKIYPALRNVQVKMKVPKMINLVPKFYASGECDEELYIILENLKEVGFSMIELDRGLDDEHCRMICETLGKFHANSFAFKRFQPEVYNKFCEDLKCIHTAFLRYKGGFLEQLVVAIQRSLSGLGKSNKMIDHYVENVLNIFMNILFECRNDMYSCILHSDGWSNNFMFKYKNLYGKKILEDMRLLDWQACCYGSPVLDLSYALYAGASRNILDNLENYLQLYYKALTTFFPKSELNIEELYPYQVLKNQWKKYCEFGIIRALMVAKVTLTHSTIKGNNGPEMTFEEIVDADCCDERLSERVFDLYEHLETIGVF